MTTATALLRPGDVIGGFRVEDVIGIGGMAIVYRAAQVSLGRPVALKVLSDKLTRDELFRERFRREGMHAASLEHPNIVPVYDSGEQDGLLYLAMRLVEGTNLAELIQTRGVTADQTIELLRPVASALDTAHAAGLIHRDVKPQNILITAQGHPYLADFGVAKGSNTSGLTVTGGFVGSVNYASPEQIKGLTLTPASDIYALTAVLYQCLTGQVPYPRETDAGIMHAHLSEPPPTLPKIGGADSDFHTVFARGMAKDPGSRYGHAGDLINAAALFVSRLPAAMRRAVPAFPRSTAGDAHSADGGPAWAGGSPAQVEGELDQVCGEPAGAGDESGSTGEKSLPVDQREMIADGQLAGVADAVDLTTADQRRAPAALAEQESKGSQAIGRPIVAIISAAVLAGAVVAAVLIAGSGAGGRRAARAQRSPADAERTLAQGLSRALTPIAVARARQRGLTSAKLAARAAAARQIASADIRAERTLRSLAVPPRDRRALAALAQALLREGSAIGSLADAAGKEDRHGYARYAAAVGSGGRSLTAAMSKLRTTGLIGLPSLSPLRIASFPRARPHPRPHPHVQPTSSQTALQAAQQPAVSQAAPVPSPSPSERSAPAPAHHSESQTVVSAPK